MWENVNKCKENKKGNKKFQETKISQSFGILVLILLLYIIWYLYKYWTLTVVLSYNKNIRALK